MPPSLVSYMHMDATHIKTKFEKLGARAKIRPLVGPCDLQLVRL